MKASKLLINFYFRLNDVRAFDVFKITAGYTFKCAAKMKLAKNIKKGFLAKTFLYNVTFYHILMLSKFLKISYVLL